MIIIVADSDVLIDYLRGHERSTPRVRFELERGDLATTSVSAFELRLGAKGERERAAVSLLLDGLSILPLDADAALRAADVRRSLLSRGEDIGMADSLIAGTCLRHGGVLLTHNTKHFERIEGLRISGRWSH
jgi:tRNA(fMet)-specific endonuclease VapC